MRMLLTLEHTSRALGPRTKSLGLNEKLYGTAEATKSASSVSILSARPSRPRTSSRCRRRSGHGLVEPSERVHFEVCREVVLPLLVSSAIFPVLCPPHPCLHPQRAGASQRRQHFDLRRRLVRSLLVNHLCPGRRRELRELRGPRASHALLRDGAPFGGRSLWR